MISLNPLVIPTFFLAIFIILTEAAPIYRLNQCFYPKVSTKTYRNNLDSLLSSLTSNANRPTGFCNLTAGQGHDTVYGLFLCRHDLSPEVCHTCIETASHDIKQFCPAHKGGYIWYDECMLRYSDSPIFSRVQTRPLWYSWTTNNASIVPDPPTFNASLAHMLSDLVGSAAVKPSRFDVGTLTSTERQIYGMVQCTTDLSPSDCSKCLDNCITYLPTYAYGKEGGRGLTPSCSVFYEPYPFYNSTAAKARSISMPPLSSSKPGRETTTLVVSITGVILLFIIVLSIYRYRWKKKLGRAAEDKERKSGVHLFELDEEYTEADYSNENFQGDKSISSKDCPFWPLDVVHTATEFFSCSNELGVGGYGPVYKGILPDGKEIAVKRMSRGSGQGLKEFKNEVMLIAKLQHRNLVRLIGCCVEGNEKLLIYEFMTNKSLDFFLFDSSMAGLLDWKRRFAIINGIARGLLYLHEDSRLKIIHRDLKAGNILLDHEMNPKISDFGLARIFGGNQIEANTTRVVGTYGYMAPEYAIEGLFSVKSDVFSFGVLMLEIITGEKNSRFYLSEKSQNLLTYAWELWSENHGLQLVDSSLGNSYEPAEVLKCIHISFLCVQDDPAHRPNMSSVVAMLTNDSAMLSQPKEPVFFVRRKSGLDQTFIENSNSVNEITLSKVSGR